ncbi:unnamed protein product [Victoria cruziana]
MPDGPLYLLVVSLFSFVGFFLLCLRCRRNNRRNDGNTGLHHVQAIPSSVPPQTSGVEVELVNSLPLIVFMSRDDSSIVGSECAVCLARFKDSDFLHLLPKCKHTFHVQCIDKWLEGHSSCPICRQNVDAQDFSSFGWLYGSWSSGNMPEPITPSGSSLHRGDNSRQVPQRMRSERDGLIAAGSLCAICLHRFQDSELLLLLPKCAHSFHVSCTYSWFDGHSVCPVCSQHIDPQELSSLTIIERETRNTVSNVEESTQSTNQNLLVEKDDPGQA